MQYLSLTRQMPSPLHMWQEPGNRRLRPLMLLACSNPGETPQKKGFVEKSTLQTSMYRLG
jgi:hypothetical protein